MRLRRSASAIAWTALAAMFAAAMIPTSVGAQEGDGARSAAAYSEDEVKAAFLYNFANYVQWPAVRDGDAPITFAVFGAPSVEAALERFVQGRTVQNRPVAVRRLRSINDLVDDEVVFIGSDENWRLRQLIAAVGGPTLIVTDAPDGLSDGAMINFQLIDRRVRFEIALPAAEAAGLMLSSRLLSAALRVETTRCYTECWDAPRSMRARFSFRTPERPGTWSARGLAGASAPTSAAARARVVVEVKAKT